MSGADTMDQQKLRTLVFEKTGIKIDATDPVFALVALNESVLEETLQRHLAMLREHAPGQWHGTAGANTPLQAGLRQPAFKAAGDNFEADDELPQPALANTEHGGASDPATMSPGTGSDFRSNEMPDAPANATAHAATARSAMENGNRLSASNALAVPWDARLLWLALAMSLATALVVLGGQVWLQPKAPSPALSGEQKALLQRAEKLGKAVEKLDAKARAQLQAELDKL